VGRRSILGSYPAEDPMEQLTGPDMAARSTSELRWTNRQIRSPWAEVLLLSTGIVVLTVWSPWSIVLASSIATAFLIVLPRTGALEVKGIETGKWTEVSSPDLVCQVSDGVLACRGIGGTRYVTAMRLEKASAILHGSLGKLTRAMMTEHGVSILVSLRRQKPSKIIDDSIITPTIERYLDSKTHEQVVTYFKQRGDLWRSNLVILGHVREESAIRPFEASLKGAIPEPRFKRLDPKDLAKRLRAWDLWKDAPRFYATGEELSEWVVQMPSELSAEVGSNVPGEFLAPIRPRTEEYTLGEVLNPETLLTGPPAGLSRTDIESGLLVCGGQWRQRCHVLMLLINRLLDDGKRVLILSNREEALDLTRLSEESVGIILGRDFILNPVDAEGMPRDQYVAHLKTALEPLADTDLSAAADLELALNRAVALGNSTVADVAFSEGDDVGGHTRGPPGSQPSKRSKDGMEAIRILQEGSGAKAFYGHQTIPTARIVEHRLTVVQMALGSLPLEMFAWELMSTKLLGTEADKDAVVILDCPENLRVRKVGRYRKRAPISERALKDLCRRGPLVISVGQPSDLPPNVIDGLSSCISLRLRDSDDIRVAADILGLNVVGSGIHSKQRRSPRESSYLRVLEPGVVLMSHEEAKTCIPLKLDPEPVLESGEGYRAFEAEHNVTPDDSDVPRTLINRVAGKDTEAAVKVLRLLQRYEPLTEESVYRFLNASGDEEVDVQAVLMRLERSSLILRGHETHGGTSYTNFRVTMKGTMALRQIEEVSVEG